MKVNVTLTDGAGSEIKVLQTGTGRSLYELLSENGVELSAPCGGRGKCGKCKVEISYPNGDREDETCLACRKTIDADMTVRLLSGENKILTKGHRTVFHTDGGEGLSFAVDIGTTTVAAYLMDRSTGAQLAATSFLNPQRIHGADVISRISFAGEKQEHRALLQNEILDMLARAKAELIKKAGLSQSTKINTSVLVGNTAMMQLAANMPTGGIAKAPYMPEYTALHSQTLGDNTYILGGCVSGYVGADTLAAMLACDMDSATDNVLLIDIGTNGEIVLKADGRLSCCSCAAGPAFEGAHISCGTGAVNGAIDHLKQDGDTFEYSTVANEKATGICGSGLVDAVNYLLAAELISPSGRMKERFNITPDVYIDPSDVCEVQLAKAAIAAGVEILCERAGIAVEDIDRVLLAGGFGNYIDVHSACGIGLLPQSLEDKVITVGNAAGDGAKMLSLSKRAVATAERMRLETKYIELSEQPDFEEIYTDNLLFVTD